ncbi:MAG: PLP-dependent aspartate aminotransferase family protein [Planctomycetota bacterium]
MSSQPLRPQDASLQNLSPQVQSPWTTAARGGKDPGDPYAATASPLYQTATFGQTSAHAFDEFDYTRTDNPTRRSTEQLLADLEHADHALLFASGMAAIAAVLRLAEPGTEVVLGQDLYGGTQRMAHGYLDGVTARHVSLTADASGELSALRCALESGRVSLVLFETPSNPGLCITDIRAVCDLAQEHGARVAVDATAMTPWLQRPLDLGADVVIHSATKGLAGHGDVTAGVVATNDPALHGKLSARRNAEGSALAPFEAWLLARGVRTLGVRYERTQRSALQLATALGTLSGVRSVHYPGLAQHPGHAIHASQASGGGILVALEVSSKEVARRLVEHTRLFTTAVSFGGVASSISLPHHMSHASVPEGAAPRPSPCLVRLSVGLEDPEELLDDLRAALRGEGGELPQEPTRDSAPSRLRAAALRAQAPERLEPVQSGAAGASGSSA